MTPTPSPGPRRRAHPTREASAALSSQPQQTGQHPRTPPGSQPARHDDNGQPSKPHDNGERQRSRTLWETQRTALTAAFPAWRIVCVIPLSIPLWFALHRKPLTPQQERDGFRPTILRGSAEDLQTELARRCRTRRLPLPPP